MEVGILLIMLVVMLMIQAIEWNLMLQGEYSNMYGFTLMMFPHSSQIPQ